MEKLTGNMPIRFSLTIITLLLTFSLAGAGVLYEWVDEKGVVTLKDTPPPGYKEQVLKDTRLPASKMPRKIKASGDRSMSPSAPHQPATMAPSDKSSATTASQPSSPNKERFTGTVELYVTDWCSYCRKALKYLNDKGIAHVAYDIEKDSAANQRYQELGGRGVPLIIIGSNKMSGFSAEALERYLNNSK